MNVVISSEAEADLEAVADWIAKDNPGRAVTFVDEIVEACLQLVEMPNAFPLVPRHEKSAIRRRPFRNYLIFYRVSASEILIVHVLHGARDYEAVLFGEA